MAFMYQIRHSKIRFLSQQCKRWYSQIPGGGVSSANCSAGGTTNIRVFEKPNMFISPRPTDPYNTVRFFAAPVQTNHPKPAAKDSGVTRLNNQIKADIVRLVEDEGHVVVSLREALERAKKLNLDLVEVDRNAKPPVCKIMDFHREKYKQQVKGKDRVKDKTEVTLRKGDNKEVRFTAKTEQKDLQMKADMAKRLMEKGYRVKCMAMGKEEEDLGGMLSRLSTLLEDIAVVESGPRVEKKQAYILVRHVKFGPLKKGPSKKISELTATRTEVENAATSSPNIRGSSPSESPQQIKETWKTTETSSASEQAESPSNSSMKKTDESKTVWSEFGKSDDFHEVFEFDGIQSDHAKGFVPTKSTERASTDPKAGHSSFRLVQNVNISQGSTGSIHIRPQFPNQGRQPQAPVNAASPSLEQKQLGNDVSALRNLKKPPVDNNARKQDPSSTPSAPSSSYGIFSTPKSTIPSQQSRVRESNMEVKPLDSKRNPSSSRITLDQNLTKSHQRPEVDQPSQGAWGIFSKDSANQNISDSKTNRQR